MTEPINPLDHESLAWYLLAVHAASPQGDALDSLILTREACAAWSAAHPELLAAETDSRFAAVALAVLALVNVDADLSERVEAAQALSVEFGLPWPPYPDAVEEESRSLSADQGSTWKDTSPALLGEPIRLPAPERFTSLEAFAAEAERLNPDLAMGEHVEFLATVARAWGAA